MGITKEQKIIKKIDLLIETNKYFNDPKYYKNNYWSNAAWDSWAAQGKAGSCICGCGYYNTTLNNTRKNTDKGGKKAWLKNVSPNLCSNCKNIIETKLNYKFKSRY